MPSLSSDARFFGIDLHALGREIGQAWRGVHDWRIFAWLTPLAPIVLVQPGEVKTFWLGDRQQVGVSGSIKASFTAVELPEELVLRRVLLLPQMGEQDTIGACALEARAASPFAPSDLAWGYGILSLAGPGGSQRQVELVLASRKQVSNYLASQAHRLGDVAEPEVWARSEGGRPIIVRGFGEHLRHAHALRWRKTGYALLGAAALLLLTIAITPTLQLRSRALEAASSYEQTASRTAPLVRKREALMQSAERLNLLSEILSTRIEPLKVLDRLTQLLPDDTALQSVRVQGAKVAIAGVTPNASVLMQLLGDEPGFREVRAPSPAMRINGSAKENFSIEFLLDPQFFGVAPMSAPTPLASVTGTAVPTAEASSAGTAAPTLAAASSGAAPSANAAQPPVPPPASQTATAVRPSFGGRQSAPASPATTPAPRN